MPAKITGYTVCYASISWKCNYYIYVMLSYVMVIDLCSHDPKHTCLTIKWHSGDELVYSKLASEAENALNVPRPRRPVIWTSRDPNGEYIRKSILFIMLVQSTILCSNMLLCYLHDIMLKIMLGYFRQGLTAGSPANSDEEVGREEQPSPTFDLQLHVSLVVHGYTLAAKPGSSGGNCPHKI